MSSGQRPVFYGLAVAALVVLVAVGTVVTRCAVGNGVGSSPGLARSSRQSDLEDRLVRFAEQLNADQRYRDPHPDERRLAVDAFGHLVQTPERDVAAATVALTDLGFARTEAVDAATGRRYVMYMDQADDGRAWGVVLVDLSAPTRVVIEVPHPNFDLKTERMGMRLFRSTPGAVLLMAGAHRKAANGAADVAHNEQSLFNALAAESADQHVAQIQLHGFADESLPGKDAVVSTGASFVAPVATRIADRLAEIGLATCRAWAEPCGHLEGTLNAQGRAADHAGAVFVHLELNWRVRGGDRLRAKAIDAVAAAMTSEV
jgi:hypothetical protein